MSQSSIGICAALIMILNSATGCSNHSDEPQQEHVFKNYKQAFDKAEHVQSQLDEAEAKRRKQMEDMMR